MKIEKRIDKISKKTAYSLIELSLVILIISILITGALSVSVTSVNNAKIKNTNDRIAAIYNAFGAYLLANGRLPCPASILKSKTADSTYGDEVTCSTITAGTGIYSSTTSSQLVYGMIPVKVLGLSLDMAEDGFGTKFAYIVNSNLTSKTITSSAPTLGFGGTSTTQYLTIQEKQGGVTNTVNSSVAFAIISYGANKSGGFNSTSSSQNTRSTDADEQDNDIGASFVSTGSTAAFNNNLVRLSTSSDVFDDIVFFKTRNDMMQDFNAFDSVPYPCQSGTYAQCGSTFTWPAGDYGQGVLSTTSCSITSCKAGPANAVRKCGAFGQWGAVTNPCS